MKKIVKGGLYTAAGASLLALNSMNSAYAAVNFGEERVTSGLGNDGVTADTRIQDIVGNAMTFLALLAVLFLLWGGFQILTAAGDDDKVSKGKTIIIQAALGLVVIFIANSVVQWVIKLVLWGGQ